MSRDCYMVFTTSLRGEANMTAGLSGCYMAIIAQELGKLISAQITREPHTSTTSSFTRCNRIIEGILAGSK